MIFRNIQFSKVVIRILYLRSLYYFITHTNKDTLYFFQGDGVRVTVINLGSTATDVPLGDVPEALSRYGGARMPVDDIVQVVTTILSLSAATCVKEIDMPATLDQDA